MTHLSTRLIQIAFLAVAMTLSSFTLAQGNSGNAPGKNRNLGHGNASNGVMAIIHTNRHVLYTGEEGEDELELSVRFPRGADLLQSGEVDAHLMVFSPEATFDVLPLSSETTGDSGNLFALASDELQALPEGVYQLGVVLTVPGGDPYNLDDWFNGLLGLVAVKGLTISSEPVDVDEDGDGEVEGDTDGDGFVEEEDETEDSTDDSTTDGDATE